MLFARKASLTPEDVSVEICDQERIYRDSIQFSKRDDTTVLLKVATDADLLVIYEYSNRGQSYV